MPKRVIPIKYTKNMTATKNNKQSEVMRHSLSHIMAAAVSEIWPDVKFAIGPAIENGFYYDFDFGPSATLPATILGAGMAGEKIGEDDLSKIEKKMNYLIKQNLKFEKFEIDVDDAIKQEKKEGQIYKVELIKELKKDNENKVIYYKVGNFKDLCRGPHIESTGKIAKGSFKLTKLAGAYWKGDEKNKMLTRVYGVAFKTKKELDEYLKMMEEAEKRDHKKLGKELDLFTFHPEAPGSAFWHPKGMIIWNILESLGKSLRKKYGGVEIQTPILAKSILWKKSGHWDHYKNDMFHFNVGDEIYALKPMDCPFNIKLYQEKQRSYRDLPIRYCEIGRVFRNEKSGELNGLFRVQHVTQDDAHIFCMESQIEQEIITLLKMVKEYYAIFKIEPQFYFADRPENYMGEISTWNKAEKALVNALKKEKVKYGLKEKDGAFYGPKIDININDALGRSWQLATIQLDFQLPQRFDLEYIDKKGAKKTPVIIHAAIFGSLERFIGIITEHYAGAFPIWLSPVQVKIISVGEGHKKYCHKLADEFRGHEIRVEVDDANETVGNKIRKATKEKM
ncbi:threonine--tRNA ligase, partial [Candidatus Parcubacteria bacterium]|nr:threonine--tRNA ligase [Candidatus Parcubacteria bacterium]